MRSRGRQRRQRSAAAATAALRRPSFTVYGSSGSGRKYAPERKAQIMAERNVTDRRARQIMAAEDAASGE